MSAAITLPLHQQDRASTLIALNNLAIDLLQGNQHRHAVATFQDALQLLKSEKSGAAPAAFQRVQNRTSEVSPSSSSSCNSSGPLVLSIEHDPLDAYNLLIQKRTSKVCLRISNSCADSKLVSSILVFNYGIAHRCLAAVNSCVDGNSDNDTRTGTFCLQIFQYAESLLPVACDNLLYRLLLTRNLMMLSCRLGLILCEHYKETLDPIVNAILEQQQESQAPEEPSKAPAA